MIPGLNLARASCAARSREGSMASSVRSSRQAASREIGSAPAFANSAAVGDSASGRKVAMVKSRSEVRGQIAEVKSRSEVRGQIAEVKNAVVRFYFCNLTSDLCNGFYFCNLTSDLCNWFSLLQSDL